jgi:hypothetical protein
MDGKTGGEDKYGGDVLDQKETSEKRQDEYGRYDGYHT